MEDSRSNETGSTLNWKYSKTPGQVSLEPGVVEWLDLRGRCCLVGKVAAGVVVGTGLVGDGMVVPLSFQFRSPRSHSVPFLSGFAFH